MQNLNKYTLSKPMTRDEAYNLLKANISKCPDVKDIATYGIYGIKVKCNIGTYTVIFDKKSNVSILYTNLSSVVMGFIFGIIPVNEEVAAIVDNMSDSTETQPEAKKAGVLGPACATTGGGGLLFSLSYGLAVGMDAAMTFIFISLGILGIGAILSLVTWLMRKSK